MNLTAYLNHKVSNFDVFNLEVDGLCHGVFRQSAEDENQADNGVKIDSSEASEVLQARMCVCDKHGHGQNQACADHCSGWNRFVVDPETHPTDHHDDGEGDVYSQHVWHEFPPQFQRHH